MSEGTERCRNDGSTKKKLPEWMSSASKRVVDESATNQFVLQENIKPGTTTVQPDTLPELKYDGTIVYSYHEGDCSLLVEEIRESLPEDGTMAVGFDLEWPVTYQSGSHPKTALVQLAVSPTKCYLFHLTPMGGMPKLLRQLIMDQRLMKVGVGIEGDLWKLERDFDDIKAHQMIKESSVDLCRLANKVLKSSERWSLDNLCRHLFSKELCKHPLVRKSDWSRYPLTLQQQQYAAADAHVSLMLYEELKRRESSR